MGITETDLGVQAMPGAPEPGLAYATELAAKCEKCGADFRATAHIDKSEADESKDVAAFRAAEVALFRDGFALAVAQCNHASEQA